MASCTVVSNIWAGKGRNIKDPLTDISNRPGTWKKQLSNWTNVSAVRNK